MLKWRFFVVVSIFQPFIICQQGYLMASKTWPESKKIRARARAHTQTHTHTVWYFRTRCHRWPLLTDYCVLFSLGTFFKDRMSFTIFRPYVYLDLRNMG